MKSFITAIVVLFLRLAMLILKLISSILEYYNVIVFVVIVYLYDYSTHGKPATLDDVCFMLFVGFIFIGLQIQELIRKDKTTIAVKQK